MKSLALLICLMSIAMVASLGGKDTAAEWTKLWADAKKEGAKAENALREASNFAFGFDAKKSLAEQKQNLQEFIEKYAKGIESIYFLERTRIISVLVIFLISRLRCVILKYKNL